MEKDVDKLKAANKRVEDSDEEHEDMPKALSRRYGWVIEDDRFILLGYVKYILPTCDDTSHHISIKFIQMAAITGIVWPKIGGTHGQNLSNHFVRVILSGGMISPILN